MSKAAKFDPDDDFGTQHSTLLGPGQAPATKVPEQEFEVLLHVPLPLDVEHDC